MSISNVHNFHKRSVHCARSFPAQLPRGPRCLPAGAAASSPSAWMTKASFGPRARAGHATASRCFPFPEGSSFHQKQLRTTRSHTEFELFVAFMGSVFQGCRTPRQIQSIPRHSTQNWRNCVEWRAFVWSGGLGLGLELSFSIGIRVAWREAEGWIGVAWRDTRK